MADEAATTATTQEITRQLDNMKKKGDSRTNITGTGSVVVAMVVAAVARV